MPHIETLAVHAGAPASRDAGVERFFVKPLDMAALSSVVKRMMLPKP